MIIQDFKSMFIVRDLINYLIRKENFRTSGTVKEEYQRVLQKHIIDHGGRDHSGSTSLLKLGQPRAFGTGLCPESS